MRFIDYKKFLEENQDFYLYKAVAVSEVEFAREARGLTFTEDEFTRVCQFVYDWTQETSATAVEVASMVCNGLADGDITIADMDEFDENRDRSKAEEWLYNQF